MHSKFQLALFFGGHCTQLGATLREINVIESNCLSISPHITPKINYKTRGNRQPVNRFWNLFSSKETGHLELTRHNSFILIVLKNSKTERFLLLRDHGHGEQPHFEFQNPLWNSRYVLRILKFTTVLRISLRELFNFSTCKICFAIVNVKLTKTESSWFLSYVYK